VSDPELHRAAFDVADSYRSGGLEGLQRTEWSDTWRELLDELRRRCPGRSPEEYEAALEDGFVSSR